MTSVLNVQGLHANDSSLLNTKLRMGFLISMHLLLRPIEVPNQQGSLLIKWQTYYSLVIEVM